MASIQGIISPLTGEVVYRAQVRRKGRRPESANFPNRKEAQAWATSIEAAIREHRHFSHAAAKRTSFDALLQDYSTTVLNAPGRFDDKERRTRERQLKWWSGRFAGLSLAEITGDRISSARDALAQEAFARGKPYEHSEGGKMVEPKQYERSGATINRYLAALSHALSFAVKDRRVLERNPVSDIRRKKGSRGRTRFLSDAERAALLKACDQSAWPPLKTLVLLAVTTGARKESSSE